MDKLTSAKPRRGHYASGELLCATALTFDIDWAPDFMVAECMDICAKAGVSASFYATHQSQILKEIAADSRFELGIHPNFLRGSTHGSTYREVLDYCLNLAPSATSMRTHSLYQNSLMFAEVATHYPQIRVDASLFLPGHENLRAVDMNFSDQKIRRLPFFWEDDVFAEAPRRDWSETLPLVIGGGIKIFAFHPVHIWINTDRLARYSDLKRSQPRLSDWTNDSVESHRNKSDGAKTFLSRVIETSAKQDFMTITAMADAS